MKFSHEPNCCDGLAVEQSPDLVHPNYWPPRMNERKLRPAQELRAASYFEIPMTSADAEASQGDFKPSQYTDEPPLTKMHTILIADDDPKILTALSRRLEANDYNVLTALDGFEALKIVLRKKPDLIILDICMPIGIGFSVAQRIHEHRLNIPIIFLTASKTPGLRKAAREIRAAGFLEKPYEPDELLHLIKTTLEKSRASVHHSPQLQTK